MILRPEMFSSDLALRYEIEKMFGRIWPLSNKAFEEYHNFKNFGLALKKEGEVIKTPQEAQIEQGPVIRVHAKTFALRCHEPEMVPLVRACLYGAVASLVGEYPKEKLQMHWRRYPDTTKDNDFETGEDTFRTVMRIGFWVDNGPDKEGIAL